MFVWSDGRSLRFGGVVYHRESLPCLRQRSEKPASSSSSERDLNLTFLTCCEILKRFQINKGPGFPKPEPDTPDATDGDQSSTRGPLGSPCDHSNQRQCSHDLPVDPAASPSLWRSRRKTDTMGGKLGM
jgi:hypothetical protein